MTISNEEIIEIRKQIVELKENQASFVEKLSNQSRRIGDIEKNSPLILRASQETKEMLLIIKTQMDEHIKKHDEEKIDKKDNKSLIVAIIAGIILVPIITFGSSYMSAKMTINASEKQVIREVK